jgi:protoporphyrin/coproporphyrin ferrochelatase
MKTGNGRIGVLVAQLGTPEAPTAPALRRYLRQFLSDQRVVDYPPFIWKPILHGIILRTRPRKSAELYARIWTDEGSPLLVISQKQVEGLQARLGDNYRVILGMTYGKPGIKSALQTLEKEGIERVIVLPMYPQYSSSTTASVYDAVADAAFGGKSVLPFRRNRWAPALRFVPPYYDHPGYIDALKTRLAEDIADFNPEKIVLSFHGVPKRYIKTGDPYAEQCAQTADLVTAALGLADDEWQLTFQSRFGPEPWLQPYTDDTLEKLGEHGTERVLVACPGFTADCLETLDEIGNEGAEEFEEAGGGELRLSPCVNDHPRWLDAMADIVRDEAQGWAASTSARQPDALAL